MIINKFFAIRFPTSKGPDMYGIATLIHRNYFVEMKNGRALNEQCLKIIDCFNPNGLFTKKELESFYSDEEINEDDSHVVFNKQSLFMNRKKVQFTPLELIAMIRKAISNPLEFEDICDEKSVISLCTMLNGVRHVNKLRSLNDIPYYWYILHEFDKHTFGEIEFEGHFPWENQRKLAEKDFFIIKVPKDYKNAQYISGKKSAGFVLADKIMWAKQFLTENEAFRYIDRHLTAFGQSGYEIEEIKGMTMEEALDI